MKLLRNAEQYAGKVWRYFGPHRGGEGVKKTFAQRTYEGFQEELPKRMSVTLFGALVGAYVSRKFQERNHLRGVLDDVVNTVDKEEDEFWEYVQRSDLVRKVPSLHLFSDVLWEDVQKFNESSFELQHHISTLKEKKVLYEFLKKRVRYGRKISNILDTLPIFRWFAILGPIRHRIDQIEQTGMFSRARGVKCDVELSELGEARVRLYPHETEKNNRVETLINLYTFALHLNKGIFYHISKRSQEAVEELSQAEELINEIDVLRETKVAFANLYSGNNDAFVEFPHPSVLEGEQSKEFNLIRDKFMREKHKLVQENPSMGVVSELISNYHNLRAKSFRQRAGYDLWDLECVYLEAAEKAYTEALMYDPYDPVVKFELGMLYVDMGNCETTSGNDGSEKFELAGLMLQDAKFLHRYNDKTVTYGEAYGIYNVEKNKSEEAVDFSSLKKSKLLFEFSLLKRRPYASEDCIVLVNYARLLHLMGQHSKDNKYFVEALEILDDVYRENPLFPLTLLVKGEVLSSLNCYEEAVCCLKFGLEVLDNISIEEDYRLRNHYRSDLKKARAQGNKKEEAEEKEPTFCSKYKCVELRRLLFKYDQPEEFKEPASTVALLT